MKKLTVICCMFWAVLLPATAQVNPHSIVTAVSTADGVIAQVVDGGSWKTIITLINPAGMIASYSIEFFSDAGGPMALPTTDGTDSTITGLLQVNGSHVIETAGTAATLSQGWARVRIRSAGGEGIFAGGTAIFRQSVPGRPDFEASMPIVRENDARRSILPFDQIASATGIAIVNPDPAATSRISMTFRDEQGGEFHHEEFDLGPRQHAAFSLGERFPVAAGRRGTVEISTPGALNVLGLRFGPASFTSILPFPR